MFSSSKSISSKSISSQFIGSKCISVAITAIAALTISGQAALAKVEAVGVHDATCSELIGLVDAGDDQSLLYATAIVSWIEGYLSGVNAANSDSIDLEPNGLDTETRTVVLVEICRQNPDATMEFIAAAYYLTLVDYQETPIS